MPPWNNFHMLCKAQSSIIEWIVCLGIFMSLVLLSLVRQNDINYFSFWPKAKIGKISPFSPLHPSPSILALLLLLPVSLGSDLVLLHTDLLIETTSTQKKGGAVIEDRLLEWLKGNFFYLHFIFLCLESDPNCPCREKRKHAILIGK